MSVYKCETCRATLDEAWCEKCQRDAKLVNAADDKPNAIAAGAVGKKPASPPPPATNRPKPETSRSAQPLTEPVGSAAKSAPPAYAASASQEAKTTAATPSSAQADLTPRRNTPEPAPTYSEINGLQEFHALLDSGFQTVVICGSGHGGKSEVVSGFTRANTIYRGRAQFSNQRSLSGILRPLGGTAPGSIWYQVVNTGRRGRNTVFLDPSGEFFRQLIPQERQRQGLPDVTDDLFNFVRRGARELAGLILVFDLTRSLDDKGPAPWREQEEEFNFMLPALRWLRFDNEARRPEIGLTVNIAARARSLPQFDVPVLILFSKADRLDEYTYEPPLDFARRRLPVLHGAVMTHASRYHYDFCHTMVRRGNADHIADRPCGVLLSMEWLLDPPPLAWMKRLPASLLGGGK